MYIQTPITCMLIHTRPHEHTDIDSHEDISEIRLDWEELIDTRKCLSNWKESSAFPCCNVLGSSGHSSQPIAQPLPQEVHSSRSRQKEHAWHTVSCNQQHRLLCVDLAYTLITAGSKEGSFRGATIKKSFMGGRYNCMTKKDGNIRVAGNEATETGFVSTFRN